MLELKNVSAGYPGRSVLKDVTLAARPGRVLILLGPNGCGKSTLLRTMAGLLPPLGGEVLLDGAPLKDRGPKETARRVAFLPQSRTAPNITARRLALHGRFPYLSYPRRYGREDYAAVDRALRQADALDLADRPVPELSGGQRQKVYLAMALAQETETILMDEPTTYLDIQHQLEVLALVRRGRAGRGPPAGPGRAGGDLSEQDFRAGHGGPVGPDPGAGGLALFLYTAGGGLTWRTFPFSWTWRAGRA